MTEYYVYENGELRKAIRPGLVLQPSKKNPMVKRWQQTIQKPKKGRPAAKPEPPTAGRRRAARGKMVMRGKPGPGAPQVKRPGIPKLREEPQAYAAGPGTAEKRHPDTGPGDTLSRYKRADGMWEPERAKLHEKIIKAFVDPVPAAAPEVRTGVFMAGDKAQADWAEHIREILPKERVAVFLMGSTAAGKTTLSGNLYAYSFVRVDPDAVKEFLPEYEPKNPGHVHEESSHIAKQILKAAMEKGTHFVKDGTGSNAQKMLADIQAAKEAGYTVVLNYVRSTEKLAQMRNQMRQRTVPADIVHEIYREVVHTFRKVRRACDYVQIYESMPKGFKLLRSEKLAKALRGLWRWCAGRLARWRC